MGGRIKKVHNRFESREFDLEVEGGNDERDLVVVLVP